MRDAFKKFVIYLAQVEKLHCKYNGQIAVYIATETRNENQINICISRGRKVSFFCYLLWVIIVFIFSLLVSVDLNVNIRSRLAPSTSFILYRYMFLVFRLENVIFFVQNKIVIYSSSSIWKCHKIKDFRFTFYELMLIGWLHH